MHLRRWLSSALVLVAAVPVLVVVSAATSRADGTVHYGILRSSFTKVTTSTGRAVLVRVTGLSSVDGEGAGGNTMTVQVWTTSRTESHQWYPSYDGDAPSDFTYTNDGYGSVDPTSTSYYAVDLQFTPTTRAKTVCGSTDDYEWRTKRTGRLRGMLFVDTHTKRWGTIGSAKREDFTFAAGSALMIGQGYSDFCSNPSPPCARLIGVEAVNAHGVQTLVADSRTRAGKTRTRLSAGRAQTLRDAEVERADLVRVAAPPLVMRLRNHAPVVHISTSGHRATGEAVVKGDAGNALPHEQIDCGDGEHRRSTTWDRCRLRNGTRPLTFHTEVFGDMRIANTDDNYIDYTRR